MILLFNLEGGVGCFSGYWFSCSDLLLIRSRECNVMNEFVLYQVTEKLTLSMLFDIPP